jgi:cystathionine gamma-synthase
VNGDSTHPETQAIHAAGGVDPSTGAVVHPLHLTTTYERAADGSYPHGFDYVRSGNPNRLALEAALATLEGGAATAAFASGSAAMMTLLQALAPGDHVIAPTVIYYGVRVMLTDVFTPWGLKVSFVDMTDLDAVRAALRPETRLVIVESPSNPMLEVTDIEAVSALAHTHDAALICDNTIATPVYQQPLKHGADLVIHATTKYLNGHSDVLGGAIIAADAAQPLFQRLRQLQKLCGAVPSPFDCWLTLRGLQTLPYRMAAHQANARQIVAFLGEHPRVERVLYPGFGALLSILVAGDEADALAVAAKVHLFTRATSFGGTHSLIEHRASIEAPGTRTPRNLLRLSVGLEHADDLIADLTQALEA